MLQIPSENDPKSFSEVSSVYLGCISQVINQGANLARNAVRRHDREAVVCQPNK